MPSKFISQPTRKHIDDQFSILQLCSGQDAKGRDFYAYINIPPDKYEEYLTLSLSHKTLDLTSFGDIIHAGFGIMPTANTQRKMEEQYGVNHNNFLDNNILKEIIKHEQ